MPLCFNCHLFYGEYSAIATDSQLDRVEQLLQQLQQQTDSAQSSGYAPSPGWRNGGDDRPREASELLQLFEREMRDFKMMNSRQAAVSPQDSAQPNGEEVEGRKRSAEFSPRHETKRRRLISRENFNWGELVLCSDALDKQSSADLLDGVVDNYFSQVHPWLPMIHETNFRQQLEEQVYDEHLEVILHAMVVAAVRLVIRPDTPSSLRRTSKLTKRSRDWVLLYAFGSLSVENLQALLIIAFDDVCLQIPKYVLTKSNNSRLEGARQVAHGPLWDLLHAPWNIFN